MIMSRVNGTPVGKPEGVVLWCHHFMMTGGAHGAGAIFLPLTLAVHRTSDFRVQTACLPLVETVKWSTSLDPHHLGDST